MKSLIRNLVLTGCSIFAGVSCGGGATGTVQVLQVSGLFNVPVATR